PINIAASSPKLWDVFCRAAEKPEWLEVPEWRTPQGRSKDRTRVNAAVSEVTRTKPSVYWIDKLEEGGIPCGPINNIAEGLADPQVKHPGMAMPIQSSRRGATHIVGTPINMEPLETGVRRDVPDLGEHSSEILAEAGLTREEIARLRAKGVVAGT